MEQEILSGVENSEGKGKFKDTEALENAYGSLQAEFTKRCQRIKELESELAVVKNTKPQISKEDKIEIIKEYLGDIKAGKSTTVLAGGQSVVSPPKKPKTVAEAGRLANEFIKSLKEKN